MKEKSQIVENWLPRYTGVPIVGADRPMPSATADGITMINFGMGSPNAATLMDLLSAITPKAVLFLGKCGGLKKKNQLGDLVLPIAAALARARMEQSKPWITPATRGPRILLVPLGVE